MSQYLTFKDETPEGRKTRIIGVYSARHGDWLGMIRWYGAWRQYTFHTAAGSIWNTECLKSIIAKVQEMNDERKAVANA